MIIVKNLNKIYKQRASVVQALDDINLTIGVNEIFGIVGESGSGKSTLLRCMNRLEEPSFGKIFFDGVDITGLSPKELREQRHQIGMIFQNFNLLNSRNVYENVALPLELLKVPKDEIEPKVLQQLKLVGLLSYQKRMPWQLSGGQKQRVAIARALIMQPKWLLCDEATSALDPKSTTQILALLKIIQKELNVTIILITHEMDVIKKVCDRVAILDRGRLIETGSVVDLFIHSKTSIAKTFIQHALHLDLPSELKEKLKSTAADGLNPVVRLAFVGSAATEPVIANILKNFNVTVNILQADLESIQGATLGFLICKLEGESDNILPAIQYLNTIKVNVEIMGYV